MMIARITLSSTPILAASLMALKDASGILFADSSLEHLRHVDMKERDEVLLCVLAREGRRRAGEKRASNHFCGWKRDRCERCLSELKLKVFLLGDDIENTENKESLRS
jgi:hypothetical protein